MRSVSLEVITKLEVTLRVIWEITVSLQVNYGLEVTLEGNSGFKVLLEFTSEFQILLTCIRYQHGKLFHTTVVLFQVIHRQLVVRLCVGARESMSLESSSDDNTM